MMYWLAAKNSFFEIIIKIIRNFWPLLAQGLGITLLLSTVGTVAGFIIALPLGSLKLTKTTKSDSKIVAILKAIGRTFSSLYITLFRGTPMIVQGIIFYYGFYKMGIRWSSLAAGLTVVSLNTAAYIAEIIRGGIMSIDPGQLEAARSLGFSHFKSMLLVVLPQAIKNSVPAIINEFIVNIKDTAVLSVIGVVDIYNASYTGGITYGVYFEAATIAATIYLILTLTTTKIGSIIERRLNTVAKSPALKEAAHGTTN